MNLNTTDIDTLKDAIRQSQPYSTRVRVNVRDVAASRDWLLKKDTGAFAYTIVEGVVAVKTSQWWLELND